MIGWSQGAFACKASTVLLQRLQVSLLLVLAPSSTAYARYVQQRCKADLYSVGIPLNEILKQFLCIIKVAQVVLRHSSLGHNPIALWKALGQRLQIPFAFVVCCSFLQKPCRCLLC